MTRNDQLIFCKKCTNRKLDIQQGLLCSLTKKKADFEGDCSSYSYDDTVKERLDDEQTIEHSNVLLELSEKARHQLKTEQNYNMGLIFGILTGIVGALIWATVTIVTEYQIGYLALAIGAGVGFAIRYLGKGIDQIFGVTGAIIAFLSCILGNFLSVVGFVANASNLGYLETLLQLDFSSVFLLMTETFSPIDLLFYGIAAYEGYKFAFRTFTEKELVSLDETD